MKIIKNEKLIERNGKIGQWTSLGALVVLGAGMYISFTRPEWFTYSIVCLVVGFIMTQIGLLSSYSRAERVAQDLNLAADESLVGKGGDAARACLR